MQPRQFLRVIVFALVALAVAGQPAGAQDIRTEKYTLPNNMSVILHEDQQRSAGVRKHLVLRRVEG